MIIYQVSIIWLYISVGSAIIDLICINRLRFVVYPLFNGMILPVILLANDHAVIGGTRRFDYYDQSLGCISGTFECCFGKFV